MGLFGWSYPPGCSGPPDDEDRPCAVCGNMPDHSCICPECPSCGATGDTVCYESHGLVRSDAQRASLAKAEASWAEYAKVIPEDES